MENGCGNHDPCHSVTQTPALWMPIIEPVMVIAVKTTCYSARRGSIMIG